MISHVMNTSIKVLWQPWNIAEVVPRELEHAETLWGWLPCLVLVTLSIYDHLIPYLEYDTVLCDRDLSDFE